MKHYPTLICLWGVPNGLCSSLMECKHIKAVKEPWQRSSKFEALGQILLTNQHLDKLAASHVNFESRGMLDQSCLLIAISSIGEFLFCQGDSLFWVAWAQTSFTQPSYCHCQPLTLSMTHATILHQTLLKYNKGPVSKVIMIRARLMMMIQICQFKWRWHGLHIHLSLNYTSIVTDNGLFQSGTAPIHYLHLQMNSVFQICVNSHAVSCLTNVTQMIHVML